MAFEWDERKRRSNLRKHGIDFEMARQMMIPGRVIEREDARRDYGETRVIAYGEVDGVVLTVVYTWRDGVRRIISARRARRNEREDYYAAIRTRSG